MRLLALLLALLALAPAALAASASLDVPLKASAHIPASEPPAAHDHAPPREPPATASPEPPGSAPVPAAAHPPAEAGAKARDEVERLAPPVHAVIVEAPLTEILDTLAPRAPLADKLRRVEESAVRASPGPILPHRDGEGGAALVFRPAPPARVEESARAAAGATEAPRTGYTHAASLAIVAPAPPRDPHAAAAALSLALLLAPVLLYHRLRAARGFGEGTRARLLALLRAQPGLALAGAARAVDVDPSTARYHMLRLVREGAALVEGERRAARYFAAGTVPPGERALLVARREREPLVEAIRAEPGASMARLARRLAIARASLSWHLRRLERAGVVRFERDGREVRVYLRQETFS